MSEAAIRRRIEKLAVGQRALNDLYDEARALNPHDGRTRAGRAINDRLTALYRAAKQPIQEAWRELEREIAGAAD